MHHGQSRRERNTHKVCKKQRNFSKTGGIFSKQCGNNNFRETRGKCTERGEIRNLWSLTKKAFSGKGNISKNFQSENLSKIGGRSETGGKCIMTSGGWTPLTKGPTM